MLEYESHFFIKREPMGAKKYILGGSTKEITDYEKVFKKNYIPLFKLVYRSTLNRRITETILKEIFTLLWERRNNLPSDNALKATLFRLANHMITDHTLNIDKKEICDN